MSKDIKHATIIGSSGFLGAWLVDHLVRQGIRVTGVSRRNGKRLERLAPPTTWTSVDIAAASPDDFVPECDAVFFLGGVASVPASFVDPIADMDGNLRAAVRILEALRARRGATSFIYASSAAVYGSAVTLPMSEAHPLQPLSPYGISKLAAETYVHLYANALGVPSASARVFSVYGPGQDKQVVYDWAVKIATQTSPLVFLGAPSVSRDFIHVSDAAAAFLKIAQNASLSGEVYNVASGVETTLADLARGILAVSQSTLEFSFTGSVREGDPLRWSGDISALSDLGFRADVQLIDGLRETYNWAKQNIRLD